MGWRSNFLPKGIDANLHLASQSAKRSAGLELRADRWRRAGNVDGRCGVHAEDALGHRAPWARCRLFILLSLLLSVLHCPTGRDFGRG
eukprot:NODE_23265_length_674_cov_1.299817.p1 GENE.NODE_23265_length_674_cov_1.299817~~NODE_23265_length_674_cov_1.299817.p1  ORF type:complete len:88 (+),score=8.46 NODE_23265_length_674_cov_1.299817:194-457(+)